MLVRKNISLNKIIDVSNVDILKIKKIFKCNFVFVLKVLHEEQVKNIRKFLIDMNNIYYFFLTKKQDLGYFFTNLKQSLLVGSDNENDLLTLMCDLVKMDSLILWQGYFYSNMFLCYDSAIIFDLWYLYTWKNAIKSINDFEYFMYLFFSFILFELISIFESIFIEFFSIFEFLIYKKKHEK